MTIPFRALIELLRPANLVTAAADILAGYAAAGMGDTHALGWLLGATAGLYGGGIVLNDYFDRNLDAVERPERPIPSGRISASAAGALGGSLLAGGTVLAFQANSIAGAVACATTASVLLYDTWGKHRRYFGPVNMGLCRALNLLLGMAAVPAVIGVRLPLALLPLIYIAAVTAVSRGEVGGGNRKVALLSIFSLGAVLAGLVSVAYFSAARPASYPAAGLAIAALLSFRVLPPFWRAFQNPDAGTTRKAVRAGVLSLVLLDASIGASYAGPFIGLIILATAVLAASLARMFAVT